MIELNNNNKFISDNRLSSMSFTIPRTVTLWYGNYTRKDVLHNLTIALKNADKEMSHKTYVRGGMTGWQSFVHNKDFSMFFTETMNKISPVVFPTFKLSTDLHVQDAWGNILKKGELVEAHTHDTYHGILYLTKGNPLIFPELEMSFNPNPGDWIISPPEVLHGVNAVEEEKEERMNIVFNFKLNSNFRDVNSRYELKKNS